MLQHFCPEVIENNIQCLFTNVDVEGSFTNQGDGIQLGMWAGAQVQQSHAPMIHHMAAVPTCPVWASWATQAS